MTEQLLALVDEVEAWDWQDVRSSNVAAIAFVESDDEDHGRLAVRFRDGARYVYDAVPRTHFEALRSADVDPQASVGGLLHRTIVREYPARRLVLVREVETGAEEGSTA